MVLERANPIHYTDTGENLHFGLARLTAHLAGNPNVELVVVGDDVSVPDSRGEMLGRCCLAGITLGPYYFPIFNYRAHAVVCKILGAGSEEDMGFQELIVLGRPISTQMALVCAALDHCHVPGRTGEWHFPKGGWRLDWGCIMKP